MTVQLLVRTALLLCLCAPGLRPQEALPATAIGDIEAAIKSEQERMGIPGLAAAIGWKGQIRYSRGFGVADVENQVAVTPQTRFRTASITKPMTAVAVMQLVSEGKLALDGDIMTYTADLHPRIGAITIRHLLCHQSGIRHYRRSGEAMGTKTYRTLSDSANLFKGDSLIHKPGAKHTYSTFGYTMLGLAIESAAQETYETYMLEHVWKPAGMLHTGVDHHFEIIPHRASGYMVAAKGNLGTLPVALRERVFEGDLLRAPMHDTSMKVPGGGVSSTAEDLVRFGMAMLEDRLVDAETRKLMWTPTQTADGQTTRSGLGWFFFATPLGSYVGHSGGQAGTTCMLAIDPQRGVVAAVMTNLQGAAGVIPLTTRLVGMSSP